MSYSPAGLWTPPPWGWLPVHGICFPGSVWIMYSNPASPWPCLTLALPTLALPHPGPGYLGLPHPDPEPLWPPSVAILHPGSAPSCPVVWLGHPNTSLQSPSEALAGWLWRSGPWRRMWLRLIWVTFTLLSFVGELKCFKDIFSWSQKWSNSLLKLFALWLLKGCCLKS